MLPQTFELVPSINTIAATIPVNADTNAVTSPVDGNADATKVYLEWTNAASLTIEGLDADGNFQTEIFTAAAGDATVGYYSSITSIVPSVNIIGLLAEYSAEGFSSPTIPINWRQTPANMAMAATLNEGSSQDATVTFQYSLDAPNRDFVGNFINGTQWFDIVTLALPPVYATRTAPVQALRVLSAGEDETKWLVRILQGDNPQ